MLKLIRRLFTEKPPALSNKIDHAENAGMERMSARRKSIEMSQLVVPEEADDCEEKKDILSRARDFEIGRAGKGYTFKGKEERTRRMGSIIKDWQDRVRHLPGFEVDPGY